MKQHLTVSFSRKPKPGGIVNVRNVTVRERNVTVRERILRLLLGDAQKLTIIVPGNTVETVAIRETEEGGDV